MKPSISEFSFGYAVTEEVVKHQQYFITSAPIFPSLKAEGKPGGGYDLQIQRVGFPIFLQFKLSHRMNRSNCKEVKGNYLTTPFFRMHLMPQKRSSQHDMLLQLDNGENEVYYVTPFFGSQNELNNYYLNNEVLDNCYFISPSVVGQLPDDEEHHLSIKQGGHVFRFSDQAAFVSGGMFGGDFIRKLSVKLKMEGNTIGQNLLWILERMESVIRKESLKGRDFNFDTSGNYFERVSYLARFYFDCETVFLMR